MNKSLSAILYSAPIFPLIEGLTDRFQTALLRFYKDPATVKLIEAAFREADLKMRPFDAYALYEFARVHANVPGDMVEIGMYRGGSAKIICSVKGDKTLYGFDTFEGLPEVGEPDTHWGARWFHKAQFRVSLETVDTYLKTFPRVVLTKGLFPESGSVLDGKRLSFVNLDVDLYKSTIESLNFLWDKMSDRGLILIHDTHTEGVKKAIREFLANHKAVWLGCGCSQLALSRAL